MIDIRKLKELVRLMVANDLTELDLRDSEEQVTLRRPGPAPTVAPATPAAPVASVAPVAPGGSGGSGAAHEVWPPVLANETAGRAPAATASGAQKDTALIEIQSPMVGTYYDKPNPDAAPFISVGTRVTPDTVVCLIEAMKIFNEIKAECAGTIERVLVDSGDPVEFGQPLFKVRSG